MSLCVCTPCLAVCNTMGAMYTHTNVVGVFRVGTGSAYNIIVRLYVLYVWEAKVRGRERERETKEQRGGGRGKRGRENKSTPQSAQCLFIVDVSWTEGCYHRRS